MATVVPTVLAETTSDYRLMMEHATLVSSRIHVDISDGKFTDVPTISLAQVSADTETRLDLHLMVERPDEQFETALALSPHLIILHAESQGDLSASIAHARELGTKIGIALLPETTVAAVSDLIKQVDHVLIFTGHLGYNGGSFQADNLEKVSAIRALNRGVEISVDGGVNDHNAADIVAAGIDVLYVGSFLQEADDPTLAYGMIMRQIGAV
jgi:ribulose-phosphate 3-epimerase